MKVRIMQVGPIGTNCYILEDESAHQAAVIDPGGDAPAILEALGEVDVSDIQVPLGSLFDLEPLWAKGPSLKAKAMTVGTVRAEFDSQLASAGVNQTLHRIWMEVDVPMTLLLPGGAVEVTVSTRLCVAETVIVGKVPDTYLQLDRT